MIPSSFHLREFHVVNITKTPCVFLADLKIYIYIYNNTYMFFFQKIEMQLHESFFKSAKIFYTRCFCDTFQL